MCRLYTIIIILYSHTAHKRARHTWTWNIWNCQLGSNHDSSFCLSWYYVMILQVYIYIYIFIFIFSDTHRSCTASKTSRGCFRKSYFSFLLFLFTKELKKKTDSHPRLFDFRLYVLLLHTDTRYLRKYFSMFWNNVTFSFITPISYSLAFTLTTYGWGAHTHWETPWHTQNGWNTRPLAANLTQRH